MISDGNAALKCPELLAPAGREDVFHAVIDAGADAVYMAGREFNMRRHRKDYNFSEDSLLRCINTAHSRGVKVYIAVNSLIGNNELEALADYLCFLDGSRADALIVQDLGVIRLHRELGLSVPLHASTMMNVNSVEYAALLKSYGFSRAVSSRDITIDEIRRIAEGSGLEMECFIHGDMCSVQSGQCYQSGLLFGKSSNRGQCMKPCRWEYCLSGESSGHILSERAYLLASKDLCLFEQLPALINAGIDALKIEGRMKAAASLSSIVSAYRSAIDEYCLNPLSHSRDHQSVNQLYKDRLRNFSTGFSFAVPDDKFIDSRGERETVFLSYAAGAKPISDWHTDIFEIGSDDIASRENSFPPPEMTVIAGTAEIARAAISSGIDNLVLSWEGNLRIDSKWEIKEIRDLAAICLRKGVKLIMAGPKIMTGIELREFRLAVEMLECIDTYCVSGLAPIELLLAAGKRIWADYNCNVINLKAAHFLRDLGVERIFPSLEASFADLRDLISGSGGLDFDILVHGPLTAMLSEHCLIAMNSQHISKMEFCRMPCHDENFSLIDRCGNRRRIFTDKYCRNHIMLEHDLAVVPSIRSFCALGVTGLRIDARLYDAKQTSVLVLIYKNAIRSSATLHEGIAKLHQEFPDDLFNYGAYPRGIVHDRDISLSELKKNELIEMESGQ